MSAAPASHSLMSIGEVLAQLRADFPDVTISKIRFLESEGLVEPARTPSGYRKFSRADVGRLRYVLATQRDHYLPLRVIKEHLDALDRGLEPPAVPGERPQVPSSAGRPDWLPGPRALGETTELRLSRAELIDVGRHRRRAAHRDRGLRAGRAGAGQCGLDRVLRRRRAGHRDGRRGDGRLRPGAAAPALVPHRRRPRGRPGRAGRDAAAAAAQPGGAGPGRGGGPRDGRPLAAAAHGAGARPACGTSSGASSPTIGHRPATASASGYGAASGGAASRVADVNELDVVGVRVEMPSNQPIVLLKESGGERYLPIWIGAGEATAIAFAQQGVVPPRPLTHDLIRDLLEAAGQQLTQVRITALRDGVFYAELVFASGAGGQRPAVGRDRARAAHRHADLRRRGGAGRGRHRDPGRAGGRGREVPRVPRPDLAGGLRGPRPAVSQPPPEVETFLRHGRAVVDRVPPTAVPSPSRKRPSCSSTRVIRRSAGR